MYTDDAYYATDEFREILRRYEDTPTLLDADDLTEVADYYLGLGDVERSDEAIGTALRLYPTASAPLSFKARGALEECDSDEAERLLALIDDKTTDDYLMLQAEIHLAKEEDGEAAAIFDRLERKSLADEGDSLAHEDLAIEVANIYNNYSLFEEALRWVDKCEDQDDPDCLELRARSLVGIGKSEEAIEAANKLIDVDAFSKRSWHLLASAQFTKGDYEDAEASCDYALAIDPDYEPCLYLKANSLFNTGKYEEAMEYYRRSRSIEKGDSWLYLNEGTCLLNLGEYHEAVEKLREAERAAKGDGGPLANIYKELAFALGADGRTDEALRYLAMVEASNDDPVETAMLRGHVLLQANRYREALAVFVKIMEETGREPQTLLRMAVSMYDNKHYKTAYAFFQILMSDNIADENFIDGFSYAALCCKALGKNEEFLTYMLLAAKRNPREAQVVLGDFFPESLTPDHYYDFIRDMVSQKQGPGHAAKKGKKDKKD